MCSKIRVSLPSARRGLLLRTIVVCVCVCVCVCACCVFCVYITHSAYTRCVCVASTTHTHTLTLTLTHSLTHSRTHRQTHPCKHSGTQTKSHEHTHVHYVTHSLRKPRPSAFSTRDKQARHLETPCAWSRTLSRARGGSLESFLLGDLGSSLPRQSIRGRPGSRSVTRSQGVLCPDNWNMHG